jgi:biopolymer transport protein ExbD
MKRSSIEKGEGEEISEVNVVPLADVSLVLLIILMLITPMVMQSMIKVFASRGAVAVEADRTVKEKPLFLEVRPEAYVLNTNPLTSELQLLANLRGELSPEGRPHGHRDGGQGGHARADGDRVGHRQTGRGGEAGAGEKGGKAMKKVRDLSGSGGISGINITPIIDITLVLLIIMLVAAPVMNIPNMEVELPEAFTSETKELNISISLGTDLRVAVDENIVPITELPRTLDRQLKLKKNPIVIIRADRSVPYSEVENFNGTD